eukprot:scaffold3015_cov76-Skeletonema_dohrnii-CCMP3373.AAC.4
MAPQYLPHVHPAVLRGREVVLALSRLRQVEQASAGRAGLVVCDVVVCAFSPTIFISRMPSSCVY